MFCDDCAPTLLFTFTRLWYEWIKNSSEWTIVTVTGIVLKRNSIQLDFFWGRTFLWVWALERCFAVMMIVKSPNLYFTDRPRTLTVSFFAERITWSIEFGKMSQNGLNSYYLLWNYSERKRVVLIPSRSKWDESEVGGVFLFPLLGFIVRCWDFCQTFAPSHPSFVVVMLERRRAFFWSQVVCRKNQKFTTFHSSSSH